jgi:hypothetical protein
MAEHEKDYTIIVNGTEHTVTYQIVTYDQVVAIEFPNRPNDPNITYAVTFEKAHSKPHEGKLAPGGQVEVRKHGTTFDVVEANRS